MKLSVCDQLHVHVYTFMYMYVHMINLTCTLQKLLPNLEKLDLSYNYIENIENLAVSHLSCCSVCMYSISTKNSAQKITSKLS